MEDSISVAVSVTIGWFNAVTRAVLVVISPFAYKGAVFITLSMSDIPTEVLACISVVVSLAYQGAVAVAVAMVCRNTFR